MASKKRGLSLEDKREKILEFFYETQDFFLLKELEKMGPRKGVISQSVKDVVQSLVDDDMVLREKIGTSIYFWSLPSQAGNQLRQNMAKLKQDIEETRAKRAKALRDLELVRVDRKDTGDREARLDALKELEAKNRALVNELERYAENDPEVWDRKRKSIKVSKDAVNRWTDNIFGLQKWCNDSFGGSSERLAGLYAEVGITEDLDYVN